MWFGLKVPVHHHYSLWTTYSDRSVFVYSLIHAWEALCKCKAVHKCWFIVFLRCAVIDHPVEVCCRAFWRLYWLYCSWQVHRQGLHSPKEAEKCWVMMAQTFYCLDRDLSSPWGPCHSEDAWSGLLLQRTAFPSSPLSLGKALVHLQPTLTALSNPGSQQTLSHHISSPPECNDKGGLASPPYKPHCPHTYITHRLISQLK